MFTNDPAKPRGGARGHPGLIRTKVESPTTLLLPAPLSSAVSLLQQRTATTEQFHGALIVLAVMWEGRDKKARTMRLTKAQALRFVRCLGRHNPATFVCEALGCPLVVPASSINGNKTNIWGFPPWADGRSEKIAVALTPYQRQRWENRGAILVECSDKANPPKAIVRQTLALTTEGSRFAAMAADVAALGEIRAIGRFRKTPTKATVTANGDILSSVSRLPERLRAELRIAGSAVAEFDIQSAHASMLGMFYKDESGRKWAKERERFIEEGTAGFPTIYGSGEERKERKRLFLSALNQSANAAHHASAGYREFERLFPLLATKIARIRFREAKTLGSILRHRLALIMRQLVEENHADGIHSIPVTDSAVVAMPDDLRGQHHAAFSTAYRLGVPLAEQTGVPALIEGSNGENYRFFF